MLDGLRKTIKEKIYINIYVNIYIRLKAGEGDDRG